MIIVAPLVILLGIILATDPSLKQPDPLENEGEDPISPVPPPPPVQTGEGSVDWMANLQAIQNFMGAV